MVNERYKIFIGNKKTKKEDNSELHNINDLSPVMRKPTFLHMRKQRHSLL